MPKPCCSSHSRGRGRPCPAPLRPEGLPFSLSCCLRHRSGCRPPSGLASHTIMPGNPIWQIS
eukprot:3341204-Prorocentrum_lima.AAC.1